MRTTSWSLSQRYGISQATQQPHGTQKEKGHHAYHELELTIQPALTTDPGRGSWVRHRPRWRPALVCRRSRLAP
jgi:hypothetical protein